MKELKCEKCLEQCLAHSNCCVRLVTNSSWFTWDVLGFSHWKSCVPRNPSVRAKRNSYLFQLYVYAWFFKLSPLMFVHAKSLQLCLTLCEPMDYSPPGSSVHGILQVRILEWAAMPSSRASSQPRDWTCISYVSCIGRQVLYHWR